MLRAKAGVAWWVSLAVVGMLALVGCGGGGGGGNLSPVAGPPAMDPLTTATFQVDLVSGKVTVTQDEQGSDAMSTQAVWTGTGVRVNSTDVLFQQGDVGRRYLRVSLTNQMAEAIGSAQSGIRVIITGFVGVSGIEPVAVANADGYLPNPAGAPLPYFLYPTVLAPGVSTLPKDWWFVVPSAVTAFSFNTRVEADGQGLAALPGVVNPGPAGAGSPQVAVRTFVGFGGSSAFEPPDGLAHSALFKSLSGMAQDAAGNLYVTDGGSVRMISPGGAVVTLAGRPNLSGYRDGPGYQAAFNTPGGIAVTADGSSIFVADTINCCLRMLRRTNQVGSSQLSAGGAYTVSTIAGVQGEPGNRGGRGDEARFKKPFGLALDEAARMLYVSDYELHRIWTVSCRNPTTPEQAASWYVLGFVGDQAGQPGYVNRAGGAARFRVPRGLALDRQGNLYVADRDNHCIRRVTNLGQVSSLAGAGPNNPGYSDNQPAQAKFSSPQAVTVDSAGYVYVVDGGNNRIRRINLNGWVTTVAGTGGSGLVDGPGNTAQFSPLKSGCAVDEAGNLFVLENSRVRVLTRIINVVAPS
jgi:sugar lactone lactonase YvrE